MYPSNEQYGLVSQMGRAAVSIPSNIAEGSSRSSGKDYTRFLEMSLGSSFELETQIIISKELEFIGTNVAEDTINMLQEEQKMIYGFIKSLTANN